jgi:hypothetical protein
MEMYKNILPKLSILFSLFILTVACSGAGKPKMAPTPASSPTPQCDLICDITLEHYIFKVSCETGEGKTSVGPNAKMQQTYDQSVIVFTSLDLDHTLTYASSNNTYKITGRIEFDDKASSVAYDVKATGGIFGEAFKICKAGVLKSSN